MESEPSWILNCTFFVIVLFIDLSLGVCTESFANWRRSSLLRLMRPSLLHSKNWQNTLATMFEVILRESILSMFVRSEEVWCSVDILSRTICFLCSWITSNRLDRVRWLFKSSSPCLLSFRTWSPRLHSVWVLSKAWNSLDYLYSGDHINEFISTPLDFENEEIVSIYIAFLKVCDQGALWLLL